MKSLVKALPEKGITLMDQPMPTYGAHEVLIKVKKTAICGTDIHIYLWDAWAQKTIKTPMITGHEFVGEIYAMGSHVTGFSIGERVSAEGHMVCGQCHSCRGGFPHHCLKTLGLGVNRPGCFAEYVVIPASNVISIPQNISDDEAAIFDPFGNAMHAALSFNLAGENVLITGAGPIGIMAAAIAKHVGARKVVLTDVNDYRLNLARHLGDAIVVDSRTQSLTEIMEKEDITPGFGVGLEMSGNPKAFQDMLSTMTGGGKIVLLGILPDGAGIQWTDVVFKNLFIKGIYGREMFNTWHKMIAMLQSGLDIKPIITHHYAVDDYQEAFEVMASGQSGKVILSWD